MLATADANLRTIHIRRRIVLLLVVTVAREVDVSNCVASSAHNRFTDKERNSVEALAVRTLEDIMFKVIAGFTALLGVALATPASAQSVYLGNSGVSVGIGDRGYDRGHRGYNHDRRHYRGNRGYQDSYAYSRCRTVQMVRPDGRVKTIRRCH